MRRTAAPPHARHGLPGVLASDPPDLAAILSALRRAVVRACRRTPRRRLRAVSRAPLAARWRSRSRHLRRIAARNHSRAQVRWPAIDRGRAWRADARAARGLPRAGQRQRAGATSHLAATGAGLQSGTRSRPAPRSSGRWCTEADTSNGRSGGAGGSRTARQRARSVRGHPARTTAGRRLDCARRRREHHGSDAGGLRAGAARGGSGACLRDHSSASRDLTALTTSSKTAVRSRSPSTTTQVSLAACR